VRVFVCVCVCACVCMCVRVCVCDDVKREETVVNLPSGNCKTMSTGGRCVLLRLHREMAVDY